MKNKKGISAIVATVLIILITVAAVTIIWAAIIPMISNQLASGTICLDAVSQVQLIDSTGYTCVNSSSGNVSLQIKHGAKDFALADVQVLISAEGTTASFSLMNKTTTESPADIEISDLPGSNEEKVFVINTSSEIADATKIDQIQIAPVVAVGNTQETCDVSATKTLQEC